jgi:DNA polymerase III subunit delta'
MFFRDIPGQDDIKTLLRRMVSDSRISHALMFYGPEGSGKLALALAFARYISCTSRGREDACGTCPSCIKYSKLAHPDLHFVFPAASSEKKEESSSSTENYLDKWREALLENPYIDPYQWYEKIGIENKQGFISTKESNEIIRKLSFKSYESEYKVLIMWLPERMNAAASNKLLKIIEEPPPETLFILVADHVSEVLPTIQSRSQMIKIPRFRDEDIRKALADRFGIDHPMIEDAVGLADGDYGKAISSIMSGEQNQKLFDLFVIYMRTCYSGKILDMMDWIEEIAKKGREHQKMFLLYGLRMLRENLLASTGNSSLIHMSGYESDWSGKFSRFITPSNIQDLYKEFNLAFNHISANAYARIVFLDLGLKVGGMIRTG